MVTTRNNWRRVFQVDGEAMKKVIDTRKSMTLSIEVEIVQNNWMVYIEKGMARYELVRGAGTRHTDVVCCNGITTVMGHDSPQFRLSMQDQHAYSTSPWECCLLMGHTESHDATSGSLHLKGATHKALLQR